MHGILIWSLHSAPMDTPLYFYIYLKVLEAKSYFISEKENFINSLHQ
jgi:hypothetical protein